MLSGIKNAWRTIFLNVDKITPIDMGGGLKELENVVLTKDKREDVAIALGVPMSKLFSTDARGLGGRGVVQTDDRRLITDTALPEWKALARELNRQVFIPLGYRLEERHEEMDMFREDEAQRSAALVNYVTAFSTNVEIASLMSQQLGIDLGDPQADDSVQAKLDKIIAEKKATPPEPKGKPAGGVNELPQPQMQQISQDSTVAGNPNAQMNNADMVAEKAHAELARYQRKALKAVGKIVEFETDILSVDLLQFIQKKMAGCKTAADVKTLFEQADKRIVAITAIPDYTAAVVQLAASINRLAE
jgi:hypothetical protein